MPQMLETQDREHLIQQVRLLLRNLREQTPSDTLPQTMRMVAPVLAHLKRRSLAQLASPRNIRMPATLRNRTGLKCGARSNHSYLKLWQSHPDSRGGNRKQDFMHLDGCIGSAAS